MQSEKWISFISINKKVLTGRNNIAGEWGHVGLPNRSEDEKKYLILPSIRLLKGEVALKIPI